MQEDIANLVHPVFTYGLNLKAQLDRGESPDLEIEQAALKGFLLNESEAKRWVDYGGEGVLGAAEARGGEAGRRPSEHFLGIRYALVCWLDEIFVLDSPWGERWNERKLEVALYGTNDRAWKFWEQARRAEARSGSDALEVFFLCVMLGFRGELREEPAKLQAWLAATQHRLSKSQTQEWTAPPELDPPTNVPPLYARDRLRHVFMAAGLLLLLLIPFVAFFIVQQLGR